jgi:glucosamine-6-phosphate deaminase
MVFAAAVSQNEFLGHLCQAEGIDWDKVEAFHMDEYVGLPDDAPQRFGNFLKEHLFECVQPGRVEYIDGNAPDLRAECARYAALLSERPIDIVCAGIGENGHMAFNDPHVADFDDPKAVKIVELDRTCRMQQVHDGAFATLDQVPTHALTLTMPTLMSAQQIYCMVPGPSKREAVKRTIERPIDTACPATAMRRHDRAVLYLDTEAAEDL